ncbi:MAG: peptidase G2 autoproteolytic cleavage domain-containing protein [Bacillota bacterium]|nr:peptidase G2 autoproteolytic cleavage domain-containing protein [Bacillota bacterium]
MIAVGNYNSRSMSLANIATTYFVVGGGSATNQFRTSNSNTYGKTYSTSGADYAEFFEWEDGNPNNEDRRGKFVALLPSGKIAIANPGDDVIGVISSTCAVLGNAASEEWDERFVKDIYGKILTEKVNVEYAQADGSVKIVEEERRIENPDYDPEREYIPRELRSEWGIVGLLGQLIVDDDGTCVVGQRCDVAEGGIATLGTKYRVIKRLDDHHVMVLANFL